MVRPALAAGIIEGRGGRTGLVADPSGNIIELFQPYER